MSDPVLPISPCSECGAYKDHAPECSKNTYEDLRRHLDLYVTSWRKLEMAKREKNKKLWEIIDAKAKEVTFWQGKFRIVKHENNQLRKKLFPGKC